MYQLEIRRVAQIILKNASWILLMTLSASLNAVIVTYVISEKYDASALVLVRPTEEISLNPVPEGQEALDFPLPTAVPLEVLTRTYSEVIRSRPVLERVATSLGMHLPPGEQTWWEVLKDDAKDLLGDAWSLLKYGRISSGSPLGQAVDNIRENLVVTPTRDTYVIDITYRAAAPDEAAAVANMAGEVFLDYAAEFRRVEAATVRKFVEGQLEESRFALAAARDKLRVFQEDEDTIAIDTEVGSAISVRSGLESDLSATERDIKVLEAEISALRGQLEDEDRVLMSESTLLENPVVGRLNADIADYEVERSALLGTHMPAHPAVLELDAKIAEATAKIQSEEARVVGSETSTLNEVYQGLLSELLLNEAELTGLRARQRQLSLSVDDAKSRARGFPETDQRVTELELEVATLEEEYSFFNQTYEDSRLREVETTAEITIVAPAVAPSDPTKPVKIYYAAAAAALALAIGIVLALVFDYFDGGLRTIEAAEHALGVPVLAAIPTMGASSQPVMSLTAIGGGAADQ